MTYPDDPGGDRRRDDRGPYDPTGDDRHPDHDHGIDDQTPTRAFSQMPEEPGHRMQPDYGYRYDRFEGDDYGHRHNRPEEGAAGPGDSPVTHYQQVQQENEDLRRENSELDQQVQHLKSFRTWTIVLAGLVVLLLLGLLLQILTPGSDRNTTVGEDGRTTVVETSEVTTTRTVDRGGGQPPVTETRTEVSTATETQTATQTQTTSVTVTRAPEADQGDPGDQEQEQGGGLFGGLRN